MEYRLQGYALLSGHGLEIGALNQPARVPEGCQVEYCDAHTPEELAQLFKEVDPSGFVPVQHVCDLDTQGLGMFADAQYDFVVCNHVIEHVANPIRVLEELFRITNVGGRVVLSAPDMRFTFDKNRPLTPFSHLLEEYHAGTTAVTDAHYEDFLRAVHPKVYALPPEKRQYHVQLTKDRREHAHVWDSNSFADFLEQSFALLKLQVEVEFLTSGDDNRFEYFGVWRKIAEPSPEGLLGKIRRKLGI